MTASSSSRPPLAMLPFAPLLLCALLGAGACGGDDGSASASGSSGTSGGSAGATGLGDCGPLGMSNGHAAEIQQIWDDNCVKLGCHTGSTGAFNLSLDDGYTAIVNVPSNQAADLMLVAPGDLEASYLWHKINDSQAAAGGGGGAMPADQPDPLSTLDPAATELIQTWIECGAPP